MLPCWAGLGTAPARCNVHYLSPAVALHLCRFLYKQNGTALATALGVRCCKWQLPGTKCMIADCVMCAVLCFAALSPVQAIWHVSDHRSALALLRIAALQPPGKKCFIADVSCCAVLRCAVLSHVQANWYGYNHRSALALLHMMAAGNWQEAHRWV